MGEVGVKRAKIRAGKSVILRKNKLAETVLGNEKSLDFIGFLRGAKKK